MYTLPYVTNEAPRIKVRHPVSFCCSIMMIGYYVRVSTLGAAWSASDTENLLTIVAPIHRPAVRQV